MLSLMNAIRLSLVASDMHLNRTRPICFPLHSVATTTNVLVSAPRPCFPSPTSLPPMNVSSTSISPFSLSLPGKTIALRSLCSQVQAVSYEPKPIKSARLFALAPVFLSYNPPYYMKPQQQRLSCAMKYCTSSNRSLIFAFRTAHHSICRKPVFTTLTFWTLESIRPTYVEQVIPAIVISFELYKKLLEIFGIAFRHTANLTHPKQISSLKKYTPQIFVKLNLNRRTLYICVRKTI